MGGYQGALSSLKRPQGTRCASRGSHSQSPCDMIQDDALTSHLPRAALERLLATSDMVLVAGGARWVCHRALLALESEPLATLVSLAEASARSPRSSDTLLVVELPPSVPEAILELSNDSWRAFLGGMYRSAAWEVRQDAPAGAHRRRLGRGGASSAPALRPALHLVSLAGWLAGRLAAGWMAVCSRRLQCTHKAAHAPPRNNQALVPNPSGPPPAPLHRSGTRCPARWPSPTSSQPPM